MVKKILLFVLLFFIIFPEAFAKTNAPFQVELLQNGKASRSLRLSNGDLTMELQPVEVKPTVNFPNRMLVIRNKSNPIDLEYVVGNHSVKENVNIEEYQKIERITFEVKLKNLTCKQEKDKIGFYDKQGKRRVYINRPYMKDMGDVNTDAVTYNLRKVGNQLFVDLVPLDDWLKDRSRVFSVQVVLPVGF
ncbi:MAG TPA: hypothetical protein DDY49_12805 [Paenibacillaceae bacterium]|nr:hypothetical protein [Paenibacillaceae bacterium]